MREIPLGRSGPGRPGKRPAPRCWLCGARQGPEHDDTHGLKGFEITVALAIREAERCDHRHCALSPKACLARETARLLGISLGHQLVPVLVKAVEEAWDETIGPSWVKPL